MWVKQRENTMANQSEFAAFAEDGFTCEGAAYQELAMWIERDLRRLEAKWMFLSSPAMQVRFAVLERRERNHA